MSVNICIYLLHYFVFKQHFCSQQVNVCQVHVVFFVRFLEDFFFQITPIDFQMLDNDGTIFCKIKLLKLLDKNPHLSTFNFLPARYSVLFLYFIIRFYWTLMVPPLKAEDTQQTRLDENNISLKKRKMRVFSV